MPHGVALPPASKPLAQGLDEDGTDYGLGVADGVADAGYAAPDARGVGSRHRASYGCC